MSRPSFIITVQVTNTDHKISTKTRAKPVRSNDIWEKAKMADALAREFAVKIEGILGMIDFEKAIDDWNENYIKEWL